jgi:hypothetical protein
MKSKRLTYKDRKTMQSKKLQARTQHLNKQAGEPKNPEEKFVLDLMQLIATPDFNIHVLLKNLNQAMQTKNRPAIDLMINSLYHI